LPSYSRYRPVFHSSDVADDPLRHAAVLAFALGLEN
jgi:hypothetical protein